MNNFDSIRQAQRNREQRQLWTDKIETLQKENLELKTRLQCNEFNFHTLLEATWLLAKLSEIDSARYHRAIDLALNSQIEAGMQVQVRDATYLTIRQIRTVLKSMPNHLSDPTAR